ncbi:MAG: Crp/Fnr family transcriptional regulator [Bacteroidetes bacterium]|nr:Crp/Fnr family transcriptional regulator [Bacteroidota bacterium]
MEIASVIEHFTTMFPSLKEEDISDVLKISRPETYQKGELLIRAGETKKEIWFVLKGLVRAYYVKENGQEMTPFFWSENEITAPWEAIYMNQPSQLNFEAVEPTLIVAGDFVAFRTLVNTNPRIQKAYMEMMEQILSATLMQSQSFRNEKPEDRYIHLQQENPQLVPRLPQKLLASFLGITPISFSRMKKRMTDNE